MGILTKSVQTTLTLRKNGKGQGCGSDVRPGDLALEEREPHDQEARVDDPVPPGPRALLQRQGLPGDGCGRYAQGEDREARGDRKAALGAQSLRVTSVGSSPTSSRLAQDDGHCAAMRSLLVFPFSRIRSCVV